MGSPSEPVFYQVGHLNVAEINIAPTGKGPMGFYDVITVKMLDGTERKIPAHHALEWAEFGTYERQTTEQAEKAAETWRQLGTPADEAQRAATEQATEDEDEEPVRDPVYGDLTRDDEDWFFSPND